ncbi:MAG: hypothetical protein Q9180_000698 [Flavoplaca navasiana]
MSANGVTQQLPFNRLQISTQGNRNPATDEESITSSKEGSRARTNKPHQPLAQFMKRPSGLPPNPPNSALREYYLRHRKERMLRKATESEVCLRTSRDMLAQLEDKYWELMCIIEPSEEEEDVGVEEDNERRGKVNETEVPDEDDAASSY